LRSNANARLISFNIFNKFKKLTLEDRMEEFTAKIIAVTMKRNGGEHHTVGVYSVEFGTTSSVSLKDAGILILQEIFEVKSPNDLVGVKFKTFQRNPGMGLFAQIINNLNPSLIAEPKCFVFDPGR
jgi:hypothetical protein